MSGWVLRGTTICLNREVCRKSHAWCCKWMSSLPGDLPRVNVKLVPKVEEEVESLVYNTKKHPGKVTVGAVTIPKSWENSAALAFKDQSMIIYKDKATELQNYIKCRKAPTEAVHLKNKSQALEKECLENKKINRNKYQTVEEVEKAVKKWVTKRLVVTTYNWKPIEYNESQCLAYLLGRSSAEYAVLYQIFNEIKMRQPDFQPVSMFDFGSGIGTGLWSAYSFWGPAIKEYFAVDVSCDMNDIARIICQGGKPDYPHVIKSSFYRQFLPATHTLRYDLVLSAFSLMELPTMKARLQTVENLWSKTSNFLILVEVGSNAGYELIAEARDFLLKTSDSDIHVFSPCNHDLTCPRLVDKTPCNFEVNYHPMLINSVGVKTERYSYVVLQKKNRGGGEGTWPRIVRPVLKRGGHVICRLCSEGQLNEAVLTSSKSGKPLYRCARLSNWGDLLPIISKEDELQDNENEQESEDEENTQK
ncbi:hypothetical protein CHUAL_004058 [Chamberlinius hualienensis]